MCACVQAATLGNNSADTDSLLVRDLVPVDLRLIWIGGLWMLFVVGSLGWLWYVLVNWLWVGSGCAPCFATSHGWMVRERGKI